MQNLSLLQKAYLSYLGRIYAITYTTNLHRFLGLKWSSWLRFLSLALIFLAWVQQWDTIFLVLAVLLAVWLNITYWQAGRAGYNKFIADPSVPPIPPANELISLPANERIQLRATGIFSVNDKEDFLLLHPAEYWQVPLGDHIIMVQFLPGLFRYQFFNAASLQEVKPGWLIFGNKPHKALAITFLVTWGPSFNDLTQVYIVQRDGQSGRQGEKRTVYFTFEDETRQRMVWHNLVYDAQRVRTKS